jgi:hypothetical protein
MNRGGLILLQVIGALSILPYPFVLLANIMSIAATGHTRATQLPWILLSFYPLVWIALYVISWQAMARGSVALAFGLSSIPVGAELLVVGLYVFSWVGFTAGSAGIGPGGLHSTTYPEHNPVIDSLVLANQDYIPDPPGHAGAIEMALRDINTHPEFLNVRIYPRGTPLNVALGGLNISVDGTINGNRQLQQDRIGIVRALVAHGAHLNSEEATDIRNTWHLRRALYDGPVTTAKENPLVWRIVTHNRGPSKPFNPLTDPIPERSSSPAPFVLTDSDTALLNRSTQLHGTPLYAALLDNATDLCAVLLKAGAQLSPEEQKDPAATTALRYLHAPQ